MADGQKIIQVHKTVRLSQGQKNYRGGQKSAQDDKKKWRAKKKVDVKEQ